MDYPYTIILAIDDQDNPIKLTVKLESESASITNQEVTDALRSVLLAQQGITVNFATHHSVQQAQV